MQMIYPTKDAAIEAARIANEVIRAHDGFERQAQRTQYGWTVGLKGTGRDVLEVA
jgi:hypothetical protein